MRVGVDESRHHEFSVAVDNVVGLNIGVAIVSRADLGYTTVINENRPSFIEPVFAVDGEDKRIVNCDVYCHQFSPPSVCGLPLVTHSSAFWRSVVGYSRISLGSTGQTGATTFHW